ncbi:MAG: hypothetical protein AUH29_07490 [Candidatus Rokubacteria bacterium 13_1_40CM_69_27]|nr:MAG: hypothetical protein AUH29_07490 [Candidatus Rokubacteria bacterium 13_1_40CM_69_27]
MPDNWSFVFAAYALAALVLGAYWRRLGRRERELTSKGASTAPSETSPRKDCAGKAGARTGGASRP